MDQKCGYPSFLRNAQFLRFQRTRSSVFFIVLMVLGFACRHDPDALAPLRKGSEKPQEESEPQNLFRKKVPVRGTFSIKNAQLIDSSGQVFVMRGVNNPHAYFPKESYEALPAIKDLGFNTVRIVWCADTLVRAGRCEAKDIHPVTELSRILSRMRELGLVAVLNLQNATGSDKYSDLEAMSQYLTRKDVKAILDDYQDMLLINVANEWYGSWNKRLTYVSSYTKIVGQLRKAGLKHTLIVDARGYGQDSSSIIEHGAALHDVDKNLMMSAHLYDVYGEPATVKTLFQSVRKAKIPFMVGEFACSHGPVKKVACDSIMVEAELGSYKIGTIAWSFTGNSPELTDLNVVEYSDWKTLSEWGEKLVEMPLYGVRDTSRQACFFDQEKCK